MFALVAHTGKGRRKPHIDCPCQYMCAIVLQCHLKPRQTERERASEKNVIEPGRLGGVDIEHGVTCV